MGTPRSTAAQEALKKMKADVVKALTDRIDDYLDEDVIAEILAALDIETEQKATITAVVTLNALGAAACARGDLEGQVETVLEGGTCYDMANWVSNVNAVTISTS